MACRLDDAKPLSEPMFVNWTLGNKLHWNLNRNLYIVIKENAFENVVGKMAAILPRSQCVILVLKTQNPEMNRSVPWLLLLLLPLPHAVNSGGIGYEGCEWFRVFHMGWFQPLKPSQCWEKGRDCKLILIFPGTNLAWQSTIQHKIWLKHAFGCIGSCIQFQEFKINISILFSRK